MCTRPPADSPCDNVLLEYLIAVEQLELGAIKAIFPVFVGQTSDASPTSYGNFFRGGGMPMCPDTTPTVAAVDAKALEHYERMRANDGCCCKQRKPHELATADRSPRGILAKLCRFQGGFVEGDRDDSLDRIARMLCVMAKEVAAGRVVAEATDGSAVRQPWAPAERAKATRGVGAWLRRLLGPSGQQEPLIRTDGVELTDARAQALVSYDVAAAQTASDLASASASTPGAGGLLFSPALGNEQGAGGSNQTELNPVLAFRAKEHRKSTAKAAREKLQEGRKTGGLRRLMPNAGRDDGNVPAEVLVDRYLESSEGGGVRPSTAKGGCVATLSSDSSAAVSLDVRQLSQAQQQRVTQRRLTKVKEARGVMLGTAEEGGQEGNSGAGDGDGGNGGDDPVEDASSQPPSVTAAGSKEKKKAVEEEQEEREETKEEADARMAQRLVAMKVQQEEERARAAEAAAAAQDAERRRPLRVSVGQVGFAALKAIVVERGVPKDQADGCLSKHALRELARRFEQEGAEALAAIEWVEEGAESGDTVLV